MAIKASLRMTGQEELAKKLRRLGKEGRSIARKSLSKAATPLVKQIKSAAPVGPTGNLKRSIGKKTKTYSTGGVIVVVGSKWPMGAHAHLYEFGSATQAPRPFMRPIWDSQGSATKSLIVSAAGTYLVEEAKKA